MLALMAMPPPLPVASNDKPPVAVIVPAPDVVISNAGVAVPGAKLLVMLTVAPVDAAFMVTGPDASVRVTLPVVLNCKDGAEIANVPIAPEPLVNLRAPVVAVTVPVPVNAPDVVPVSVTVVP